MLSIVVYKIRNKQTGLFCNGNYSHRFSHHGKIYDNYKNAVYYLRTMHLHVDDDDTLEQYKDCEIVKYTLHEIGPINED